jgi:mono/diheme cytochrome c family protein
MNRYSFAFFLPPAVACFKRLMALILALSVVACGSKSDSEVEAVSVDSSVTPDSFLTYINVTEEAGTLAYAQAYYRAVDPNDTRTTLEDWKSVNGFDQGDVTHTVFRDTKDLGYGRDMYARSDDQGNISFYVDNYVVVLQPGNSSNYGPLNLDAAIAQDRERVIGSNAIEFSPIDENDPASKKVLKFYTYGPPDGQGQQARLTSANLDGRGTKFMPDMCLVCHGGSLYPLDENGDFRVQTLESAKPNLLDVDTFEFEDTQGYSLEDQQAPLKQINQWVHQIYQTIENRSDDDLGKWSGSHALDIAQGHYGNGFTSDEYNGDYVPVGWQANADRPAAVESLYLEVVQPYCIGCHAIRGTAAGEREQELVNGQPLSVANAINFSSYEKFISYNDRIIEYVYRRGIMPLTLRGYEKFWEYPESVPSTLASFLSGFDVFDENRNVVEPGRPFARIGSDRTQPSPVALSGSASLFADRYRWQIINAPVGAQATLSSSSSENTVLTTDTDGEYQIQLTVVNGDGVSSSDSMNVTVDSRDDHPSTLTFVDDIRPILGSNDLSQCSSCHSDSIGGRQGITLYYDDSSPTLYRDVKARANFDIPEESLLLTKPTGNYHGGGVQLDRLDFTDEQSYQTLLAWIRAGAPCGDDVSFCDE